MCEIEINKINVKAKTTDNIGIIGKNRALATELFWYCYLIKMNCLITLFGIGNVKIAPGSFASFSLV